MLANSIPRWSLSPPSPILLLTNHLITGGAETWVVAVSRWMSDHGAKAIVAASPGELVDQLDPAVTYYPVDLTDLRWKIPVAAARVARILRQHRPKVIVANSLVTAWVARLADPLRTIPVVAIAHGWPVERYRLVSAPLRVADRVVAVSDDVRRRLLAGGLDAQRCVAISNGIDTRRFGPRTPEQVAAARLALGAGPEDVVLVNVGRFVPQKRQERIVALAAQAPANTRFVIIGWGPGEADLRAAIASAGVGDRVRLIVRPPSVADLLMASDIYLSTSDWEGMPLSTIEAMAAGLPVVSTDVEGLAALVGEDNGVRVPVGDAGALSAAVGQLVEDEALRLRLGAGSRARVDRELSLDVMCGRLVGLMNEVTGG